MANALTDESFQSFYRTLVASIVQATRAASYFDAEDTAVLKAENADFKRQLDKCSRDLLSLGNDLLVAVSSDASIKRFNSVHDVTDRWTSAVDVLEELLEKADVDLDRALGKVSTSSGADTTSVPATVVIKLDEADRKVYHAPTVSRPQEKFSHEIDNSLNTPFVPRIKTKPNAKISLDLGLDSTDLRELPGDHVFPHPYEHEIRSIEYPAALFESSTPISPLPWEVTPYQYISTESALYALVDKLKGVPELAVDLEQHSFRSYQGFLCLMQISTREADYLIDILELRSRMWCLNEIFTDPSIIKVFHGADHDVIWLQRDLGLYLVNLFDTYHASKVLNFGKHSLASLLKMYCDIDADKKYQTADWRIRSPLPKEFIDYARSDTHYLLYIYDNMRNELIAKDNETFNLVKATLQRSAETSLKRYHKDNYDIVSGAGPHGWLNLYNKHNKPMTRIQFAVYKEIHQWRDEVARDEDESTAYILPNHMLFNIADRLPTDPSSVLACCTPIPPLVRIHSTNIALIVRKLKDELVADASTLETNVGAILFKEPTHIMFGDDETVSTEMLTSDTSREQYVCKYTPVMVVTVHRSSFFGETFDSELQVDVLNSNKVKQIRSATLSLLEALLPKSVPEIGDIVDMDTITAREPHDPPALHAFVPAHEREKDNGPIIIRQLKQGKRLRENEIDMSLPVKPKKSTTEIVDLLSDTGDSEPIPPKQQSNELPKEKKKRRDIKSFDYSQAQQKADFDESLAPDSPKDKQKPWKPYNNEEKKPKSQKKDIRIMTAPKSGNKSETFSVNK